MRIHRRKFGQSVLAASGAIALGKRGALAQRLPQSKEVAWLREIQTRPAQVPEDVPPLVPLLVDPGRNPIRTRQHWEQQRDYLRSQWHDMIGAMELPVRRPPQFEIRESDLVDGIVRRRIAYESERDLPTEAYLLMPRKPEAKLPAVVVLHATTNDTIRQPAGLTNRHEAAWGLELAKRGMVVICPRCFLWDEYPRKDYEQHAADHRKRHPLTRGIAKMLYDAQRAIDLLETLNEVDPRRIGAAGHSLGAKEVLYLAAFDTRVKAAVSSEGGIGFTYSNWDAPWYWGSKEFFGRNHHELLAIIAPRAFLLIGGESADGDRSWPFIEAVMPVYRFYGEPARFGLFNHRQGHSIPPVAEERVYEWLQTYL